MGRYTTTEPPSTTRSAGGNGRLSSSDTQTLQAAFGSSPVYTGYSAATVHQLGIDLIQTGEVNDSGHTFGTFNRDYVDSPDLASVSTGPAGLPGTPYTPNTASPGEGNGANPTALPAPPYQPASTGNGSSTSPSSTSTILASETMGTYIKAIKRQIYP